MINLALLFATGKISLNIYLNTVEIVMFRDSTFSTTIFKKKIYYLNIPSIASNLQLFFAKKKVQIHFLPKNSQLLLSL